MRKISIIVPCYNAVMFLVSCLQSIQDQTFSNFEVVCINDGSTDSTATILADFVSRDTRFIVFNQENLGISQARNLGLSQAKSDFILFVDSDDWLEKDTLQIGMDAIQNVDIVFFSYFKNNGKKQIVKDLAIEGNFDAAYIQRRIIGLVGKEIRSFTSMDALALVWGKLYRKSVLKNVEFTNLDTIGTWEDGLFNVQVLENCSQVKIINTPLYHYRKNNSFSYTSLHKPNLPTQWETKFKILDRFVETKDSEYLFALNNRKVLTILNLCFNEHHAKTSFARTKRRIAVFLNNPNYLDALEQFKVNHLPIHWRVFYYFVKKQNAFWVTCISKIIYLKIK